MTKYLEVLQEFSDTYNNTALLIRVCDGKLDPKDAEFESTDRAVPAVGLSAEYSKTQYAVTIDTKYNRLLLWPRGYRDTRDEQQKPLIAVPYEPAIRLWL